MEVAVTRVTWTLLLFLHCKNAITAEDILIYGVQKNGGNSLFRNFCRKGLAYSGVSIMFL